MVDKKNVIIDTDGGVDDALAIYMALSTPHCNVIAITTTFGNVSLESMVIFGCFSYLIV